MTRCSLAAIALMLAAVVASPALGEPSDPRQAAKLRWQADYQQVLQQLATANADYEAARRVYNKNKQNRHKRGEARREINEKLRNAQIAKAKAEAELREFPEVARRSGIPPGWLREVEESAPPAQRTGDSGS